MKSARFHEIRNERPIARNGKANVFFTSIFLSYFHFLSSLSSIFFHSILPFFIPPLFFPSFVPSIFHLFLFCSFFPSLSTFPYLFLPSIFLAFLLSFESFSLLSRWPTLVSRTGKTSVEMWRTELPWLWCPCAQWPHPHIPTSLSPSHGPSSPDPMSLWNMSLHPLALVVFPRALLYLGTLYLFPTDVPQVPSHYAPLTERHLSVVFFFFVFVVVVVVVGLFGFLVNRLHFVRSLNLM